MRRKGISELELTVSCRRLELALSTAMTPSSSSSSSSCLARFGGAILAIPGINVVDAEIKAELYDEVEGRRVVLISTGREIIGRSQRVVALARQGKTRARKANE